MKVIHTSNLVGTSQPMMPTQQIADYKPFEIDKPVAPLPAPKTVIPAVKTISEPAPTPAMTNASDEVISVRRAGAAAVPQIEQAVITQRLPEIRTQETAPAPRQQVIQILPPVTDTKVPAQLPTIADLQPGPAPAPLSDEVITLKKAAAAPNLDVAPEPRPQSGSNSYAPLDPKDLGLIPQGSTPPPVVETKTGGAVLPPATPISGPIGKKKSK